MQTMDVYGLGGLPIPPSAFQFCVCKCLMEQLLVPQTARKCWALLNKINLLIWSPMQLDMPDALHLGVWWSQEMCGPFSSPMALERHLSPYVTGSSSAVASPSGKLKLSLQNQVCHMAPGSDQTVWNLASHVYRADLHKMNESTYWKDDTNLLLFEVTVRYCIFDACH